ncbi:unnamed protein product [Mycena citricolor]|uniref:Alpha-amylase n=1 Tax=Mycena citricolor TaxID=2018698 RepID=A0AAD2H8C1_9AGAR|nr:unnamed protein product [Mycena citricolor]
MHLPRTCTATSDSIMTTLDFTISTPRLNPARSHPETPHLAAIDYSDAAMWSSALLLLVACATHAQLAQALVAPAQAAREAAQGTGLAARATAGPKTVIVQMFQWSWDSVAAECTNFLGPAGYGYVQGAFFSPRFFLAAWTDRSVTVSPPQEHITGPQWWTDYQPVSYILTSKRGNQQHMVSTCHSAGVKVIADTIFNHMSSASSGTGVAGSTFTHYGYPAVSYSNSDFHHCGLEPNDDIVNYTNRLEVQTCQLDGLADLATNTTHVQQTLVGYANHLLSLGVDGLRLDASKHIATTEIATILGLLSSKPYITQEVIWGPGEPIQPTEYVTNGDVQEFRYTSALMSAFLGGGISSLQNLDNRGWVSGSQANIFVANHDTERSNPATSLNINSPSNTYITATIFSLAHPYGSPTILSSYSFTAYDDGAPNGNAGVCSATGGASGWLCQHRFIAFTGMVGWRNQVGSAAMVNWIAPSSQQIAFGRGTAGFVAINNADSAWTATFTTSLPNNAYCDVISGSSKGGACTGAGYTVSGGTFTATVSPRSAIALHTGQLGTGSAGSGSGGSSAPSNVAVTFAETATTVFGENIFIVGSIPQLGSWAPASSIALSSANYPVWSVTLSLPANTSFQYKFIRKETDGSIQWESDPNRSFTTGASGTQTVSSSWR